MEFELDIDRFLTLDLAATLVLVLILVGIRAIAGHAIKNRTDAAPHAQRRWTANIRNALFFIGLLGVVLIWAPQLRAFALSLTAVAVAIVVATKELILCLSGSFLRASSRSFGVGDWIEVGGIRGEIIDHTVLATKLDSGLAAFLHADGSDRRRSEQPFPRISREKPDRPPRVRLSSLRDYARFYVQTFP